MCTCTPALGAYFSDIAELARIDEFIIFIICENIFVIICELFVILGTFFESRNVLEIYTFEYVNIIETLKFLQLEFPQFKKKEQRLRTKIV